MTGEWATSPGAVRRHHGQSQHIRSRVVKRRELWLLDNVRIHLDEVEVIGNFIEFEAIVDRDHDTRSCHETIGHLREIFRPTMGEPVGPSYSDMVAMEIEC